MALLKDRCRINSHFDLPLMPHRHRHLRLLMRCLCRHLYSLERGRLMEYFRLILNKMEHYQTLHLIHHQNHRQQMYIHQHYLLLALQQ